MRFLIPSKGSKLKQSRAFSNNRENSSQENKIRDLIEETEIPRHDRLLESMEIFQKEMNMRFVQMYSLIYMMHSQINMAISSAISDRVLPEILNIVGSLSSEQRDTESGTSTNNQETSEETNGLKTKITKKDTRSAFDLRDTGASSVVLQIVSTICNRTNVEISQRVPLLHFSAL